MMSLAAQQRFIKCLWAPILAFCILRGAWYSDIPIEALEASRALAAEIETHQVQAADEMQVVAEYGAYIRPSRGQPVQYL